MENRKYVVFFVCIPAFIAGLFISVPNALAYNSDTHSLLTQAAVDFYNQNSSGKKFPEGLVNYLIDGARREDDVPRWGNHFYDPVYNRGLTYDASVNPLSIGNWEASKNWAQDSANQNNLLYKVVPTIASILTAVETGKISDITTETDFTWKQAIDYYIQGEWEKSAFALGHVLHLIEDASVPAHTRNDPHATGDSYETWTSQFTPVNPDLNLQVRLSSISPIGLNSLNEYFDGIATYSNNNFYSDNTIGLQSKYDAPEPDGFELKNGYYYGFKHQDGVSYDLLVKQSQGGSFLITNKDDVLTNDEIVMNNYWSRLSTKAVQYASGVIHLFFNEAEAAAQAPHLRPVTNAPLATVVEAISSAAESVRRSTLVLAGDIITALVGKKSAPAESVSRSADVGAEALRDTDAATAGADLNVETFQNSNDIPGQPAEAGVEAQLRDIASKLQVITEQADALKAAAAQETSNEAPAEAENEAVASATPILSATSSAQAQVHQSTGTQTATHATFVGGGGGGGGGGAASQPPVYPKLLITEVQIASASSTHGRFAEVYNPNDAAVDLTNWYLQRKTASSSSFGPFAPKTLLEGKVIASHGYFLIAHPSSTFAADVFTTYALTANNTLVIKDPNGDIRDKVGWGGATDCEGACAPAPAAGESMQRKYSAGIFQDTDQNADDFAVLNCPSPKSDAVCAPPPAEGEATSTEDAAASTATSTVESSSTPPEVASGTHVLISEIMPGELGAADGEWVELYNPTDQTVSLNGWALKRKTSGASTSTYNLVAADSFTGSIAPRKFFLIASREWTGTITPDLRYSQTSQHLAGTGNVVLLYDSEGDVADEIAYESIAAGKSWERKARLVSGCVAASGDGEFLGNGCAATSTDPLDLRDAPYPQNAVSLPEPRPAPALVSARATAAAASLSISFEWNESPDADGATSSVNYVIAEASSGAIFASTTATTSMTVGITEVGRPYNLSIRAVDRDGLASQELALRVDVPSVFTGLYFYRDPRDASGQSVVIDAAYDHYPLIFGDGSMWEMAVFRLNDGAPENYFANWPSEGGALTIDYPRCYDSTSPVAGRGLLLPNGAESCNARGGGVSVTAFPGAAGYNRFIVPVSDAVSPGDYVAAAFYRYDAWPNGPGFYLTVRDAQKRYFTEGAPSSSPPTPPTDITFGAFDDLHSTVTASWPEGAADRWGVRLRYAMNFSTSSALEADTWRDTGTSRQASIPVSAGATTTIGVRAVDDFGSVSEPVIKGWNNAPAGYVQLPHQGANGQAVGSNRNGGAQRIVLKTPADIDEAAMWAYCAGCGGNIYANSLLEIVSDSDDRPGDVLATSSVVSRSFGWSDEIIYTFSPRVHLEAGTYWLRPTSGGLSSLAIYGSVDDAYADGYWSEDPTRDAYFYLHAAE